MLKITRATATAGGWKLRLEGSMAGHRVDALREYCELALRLGGALTLDLSGVGAADATGLRLLNELTDRQVALTGRPHFLAARPGGCRQ